MSVGAMQATLPHYEEALGYWNELTSHCQQQADAVNRVVAGEQNKIQYHEFSGKAVLACGSMPSTEVSLSLMLEAWGPQIRCSVRGEQAENIHFYPEECDFSVSGDQYDEVIAITPEGKSLSPHDFAKYVLQHFRRSYPGITLPCPESPVE